MEMVDRINNVRNAWNLASSKGYFSKAIVDYTAPDFLTFASSLIPGLLAALLLPIIGQVGGGLAGTALGTLIAGATGQVEVVPVLTNLGRAFGVLVADAALLYMGIMFIKDFILPRLGSVGELIGKGCLDAYNAPPNAGERLLDAAALEMADGVGVFLGLVLMGIVMYMTRGPIDRITRLNASILAKTCPALMDWVARNTKWLSERYSNGPTKIPGGAKPPVGPEVPAPVANVSSFEPTVIEGGVAAGTRTALQSSKILVKRILPQLVSQSRTVSLRDVGELDAHLTKFGFRLVRAEAYGPDKGASGWQLFWQNGNVLVRFKTTGENGGPRQNIPHLSIGFNDAKGLDWQNDQAKFTFDGKVVAKVITDPAKFNPTDFQGNPQKFVLIPTNFDMSAVDAWAARTHFNVDKGFTLKGLQQVLSRAPR